VRWRAIVQQLGGNPTSDSGASATWSKTVMGTAKRRQGGAEGFERRRGERVEGVSWSRQRRKRAARGEKLRPELVKRRETHIGILKRLMEAA
jgi:hypothetical protein